MKRNGKNFKKVLKISNNKRGNDGKKKYLDMGNVDNIVANQLVEKVL